MKRKACFRVVDNGQIFYTHYDMETKLLDLIPDAECFSGADLVMQTEREVPPEEGDYTELEHLMLMNSSYLVAISTVYGTVIIINSFGYVMNAWLEDGVYKFSSYALGEQVAKPFKFFRSCGIGNVFRLSVTNSYPYFASLGLNILKSSIFTEYGYYPVERELLKVDGIKPGTFASDNVIGLIQDEEGQSVIYRENNKLMERRV